MIKRQYLKTTEDFKDNMGGLNDLVILTFSDEDVMGKHHISLRGTTSEIVYETVIDDYQTSVDLYLSIVRTEPITFEKALSLGLTKR